MTYQIIISINQEMDEIDLMLGKFNGIEKMFKDEFNVWNSGKRKTDEYSITKRRVSMRIVKLIQKRKNELTLAKKNGLGKRKVRIVKDPTETYKTSSRRAIA